MTHSTRPFRLLAPLLALPLSLCSAWALAAPQDAAAPAGLQRVEVSGHAPTQARTDVHATCPGIDRSVQDMLSPAVYREAKPGLTKVTFRMRGGRVFDVGTSGGPRAYSLPIRRAVHGLDCKDGGEQEQLYSFVVEVKMNDDAADRGYQVALLQP